MESGGLLFFLLLVILYRYAEPMTKVVVPAIYKEFHNNNKTPEWLTNSEIQAKYNFSTFLYQKLDYDAPNYIGHNHGTEGAVYLKYIIDHYDTFPDVAIFVHAKPHEHSSHWLDLVGCIRDTASFININNNFAQYATSTVIWEDRRWNGDIELWFEQCFRDVLKILFDLEDNPAEFNAMFPPSRRIDLKITFANQFILSRDQMRRRPRSVYKKLYHIINEQDVCHEGEPDYDNLFATKRLGRVGPEPLLPPIFSQIQKKNLTVSHGGLQGGAVEFLGHMIFGGHGQYSPAITQEVLCKHFKPNCPHSPCNHRD